MPDLLRQVQEIAADGHPVVIDLSKAEMIDVPILRTVLWARRYCAVHRASYAVIAPRPGVLLPQEENLLRELLTLYPDHEACPLLHAG